MTPQTDYMLFRGVAQVPQWCSTIDSAKQNSNVVQPTKSRRNLPSEKLFAFIETYLGVSDSPVHHRNSDKQLIGIEFYWPTMPESRQHDCHHGGIRRDVRYSTLHEAVSRSPEDQRVPEALSK
jgi:hypothetical protein